MVAQRESVKEVIRRCKKLSTKIVAGGPLFTSEYEKFEEIDHLVLNEAEVTLPPFLEDLGKGRAKHIYTSEERPDIRTTPIPAWFLLDMNKYATMSIQYSRGCPFDCEFCDIVVLLGHKVRTKSRTQFIAELDILYDHGWRGSVFVVDDNFIGNKGQLKEEILPAIIGWQKRKKYPFALSTQTSINLADDEKLMRLMVEAGFDSVFVGIETINEEGLTECNKRQNQSRDLVASVKTILNHGLQVWGGFILGFDSDTETVFENLINFIQKSRIVMAMVGLLNAPRGTKLHKRLEKENRLLPEMSGSNTDGSTNFITKMDRETLFEGYKHVLTSIYSPELYCKRIETFLREYKEYKPKEKPKGRLRFWHIQALIKISWVLGVREKGRLCYWKFVALTIFTRPSSFLRGMSLIWQGFHFRRVTEKIATSSR
jgi:radical SAM superfamily enzyme YgiQ (UPF0313 family)